MGSLKLPNLLVLLCALVLAGSLVWAPTAAEAIAVDADIVDFTAGYTDVSNLANEGIDAGILELVATPPVCEAYTTWSGIRICTKYSPGSPSGSGSAGAIENLGISNNDRYYINPSSEEAAMRVDMQISLLKSEVQRVEISAEVAQAHAGSPIYAFLYNHDTGRYDFGMGAMGSYSGMADGIIDLYGTSSHVSNAGTITVVFVNTDAGIEYSTTRRRAGMYVDAVSGVAIPEPSTTILTSLGLLGLAYAGQRTSRSRVRD